MKSYDRGRQRLGFGLGAAALALLLIAPLAPVAFSRSADQAQQETLDRADERLDQGMLSSRTDEVEPPQNTW
ncbi:MAG: hypothetical protein ACI8TP_003441 [Acidimicrobiales bacterium]